MKRILVLGSTGSIGLQTLDLVRSQPGAFEVIGLAACSSWRALLEQAREFRPARVALSDEEAADALRPHLPAETELLCGPEALERLVRESRFETCVHGVVGAAGLGPSVAVLEAGRTLALANKESLVVAGRHLMELAREHDATLVPVDSEHSAIFQCLRGESIGRVRRILLTASGGPFRQLSPQDMAEVTPEMALRHPNWDMGPRITVGSATLMNKALEVIEVHHLFGLGPERIEVVIHPQSIVHSMVEFVDGSVVAQMGPPDMRGPIHYALHHPDRRSADLKGFDLDLFRRLDFSAPDPARFPALELGFRCIEEGADAGSVLNAADEVAVAAFLERAIPFPAIPRINALVLDQRPGLASSLDDLLESDARARKLARREIAALSV
ncbi:MAG: 1-deoxy-D-xylulose-5-phosphate reductoisomerase [Planctomycetes bacterium]|jgi:1-deoxy-D-xylulose-5-phosphate reductoisomerase|nr:1-deoxy-D-xylulose-5-phosphate reductoisomerase [Planctomycetota bacterium]MDP6410139.1 1-deoxy-D-xylulose-5-phosphate reductoisomerase [Planctomycetota bacterium]